MKYLVKPDNGFWVAVKPELEEADLVKRIQAANLLVSDLDDTDAPSPAKSIAYGALLKAGYLKHPSFWLWCFNTFCDSIVDGKGHQSNSWKDFVELFLRDPAKLEQVKERFTPEYAASTLFPGVQEFYSLLPEQMLKMYISRNIGPVCDAYKEAVGFDGTMPERFDKAEAVETLLKDLPNKRRIIVKGDSTEDGVIIEVLRLKTAVKRLDDYLTIYVARNPDAAHPAFDINIGQDYTGLNEILRKH